MSSNTDEKLDEATAQLRIRPLRSGDDGPIRDIFAGMSAKSRFLRFHSPMPRLSPAMLHQLAATKPGHHIALVASVSGRDVGIARWVRDIIDPQRADVGVSVADKYQGRGIGRALLETLARDAENWGVTKFSFVVHRKNVTMLRLLHSWGASVHVVEDGYEAVVPTAAMKSVTWASMRSRSATSGR
jgi:GNAT superfamily N-acetyltransferase